MVTAFGRAVAIDGDTVVVGAPESDMGNASGQGSAYIFERNAGGADAWGQVARLLPARPATENRAGYAVAIDGDTVEWGPSGKISMVSPIRVLCMSLNAIVAV
ncbi:MAG: hypothetical protein HC837_04715 [Chloroflexaceae bacterium]|nr:hypothetical protein [Chloroflexaceae bacterium]